MIYFGENGPTFASWSGAFLILGLSLLFIFLIDSLKDIFTEYKSNKRQKKFYNIRKETIILLFVWLIMWIPFIGFIWLLLKLGL